MTRQEFEAYFIPIASVKISSQERIKEMTPVYYNVLREFQASDWKEITLQYASIDDSNRFPFPAEFKMKFNEYLERKNANKSEEYYHSEEYKRRCTSPAALQARREFYETVSKLFESKREGLKKDSGKLLGIGTFTESLFEEIIERPIILQNQFEEKELERKRTIEKANAVDNI